MRPLLLLLLTVLAACDKAAGPAPVRIAGASDLNAAFQEIGDAMSPKPVFSFGSSGLLARQLIGGAPFDLFASANREFVDQTVAAGVCDSTTLLPYARGRLAVWSKAGPVKLEELGGERFKRIAIANPEHAPYGRAAKEALSTAGLWLSVEPRLVYGENIRQALQLAQTGNVEVAVVALALVQGDPNAVLIEAEKHQPLVQYLALCKNGQNRAGAEAFVKRVGSQEGRAVLARYGFEPPP